jgi:cell division cycle 20-like protein 1 (cofactor of APC complex)
LSSRRKIVFGDRFIPNREDIDIRAGFKLLEDQSIHTLPEKEQSTATENGSPHFRQIDPTDEIDSKRGNGA